MITNREHFMIGHPLSIYRLSAVQFSCGLYEIAIQRQGFDKTWGIDYYWQERIFLVDDVMSGLTLDDVVDAYRIANIFYEDMAA